MNFDLQEEQQVSLTAEPSSPAWKWYFKEHTMNGTCVSSMSFKSLANLKMNLNGSVLVSSETVRKRGEAGNYSTECGLVVEHLLHKGEDTEFNSQRQKKHKLATETWLLLKDALPPTKD